MSERFLFADLLGAHIQQRDLSLAQVARLADLPRRTLANWVEGRVQRPRQWQQVMAVAVALQLDSDQMLALLAAAGHALSREGLRALLETADDQQRAIIVQKGLHDGEPGWNPQPLPADLTPFVGRTHERLQVAEIVAEQHCRLLTLLGLGGSGKTRLALQLARELQPGYEHGAAFLLLPPPTQADVDLETNLVAAILSGLANPSDEISPQLPLARKLNDILAQRQLLLILDNFDPYLEAAHVLPRLLQFAPRLQLLVTCRQSLAVEGEWCYEVPGLSLPDDTTPVEASDAANLFVSSGRRLRSDFTLATENAAAIVEICRVLGGHPLAIECELTHILVAWQLALSRRRFTSLAQAQKGLFRYFRLVGPWSGGERVFRQAVAYLCRREVNAAADPELCAQLLLYQAFFLQKTGQYEQALVANSKAYTLSMIAGNPNLDKPEPKRVEPASERKLM